MNYKRISWIACCFFSLSAVSVFSQNNSFHQAAVFKIGGTGGWDYLAVNGEKLYVSHGTQVNILNKQSGDSISYIPNTTGVHGIAFIPSLNKGYTSNGRLNNVTVFDLSSNKVISQIATGQNPDAIMYDDFTKRIITCNGRSNDLSIIDPATEKVVATIPVGGKPETAVSNGSGSLFVNIEDKNEIVQVNLSAGTVTNRWKLGDADGPTGLAYDQATQRLFSGCDKTLVVLDAQSGKIVKTVAIGDGCDGVAFDKDSKTILTSNGEGTMTVIKEESADKYTTVATIPTKKGARTIALDEATHTVYLPTAEFETTATTGGRPPVKPGTFMVLVYKK